MLGREQKQDVIHSLRQVFTDVESIVVAGVEGLNADQISTLRRRLHESNVQFRVVRNNLARLAAKETDVENLADDFVGSTALAWSRDDAVAPAKVLVKFQEEVNALKVRAGWNAKQRLGLDRIKALAALPSLDELRAQLLGVLQSVPAQLLSQINAPASHVVGVVQAKVDKDRESV